YDLVVMDPPWPNKSVHRSSHYETQDIYDLYQIPLTSLVHKNSLVAVWITNKPKYRRFVMDKLFKSWHVDCVAEWTWLKVTNDGEPVFPLNSTHRKPYEQLIIGRYNGGSGGGNDNNDSIQEESEVKPIPYQHSIVSVPSKRHSRKPPLQDLLQPYLPAKPRCLELFARCLTPGWSSWGNECLKFQNEYYYTRIENPLHIDRSDV
ncbi:MT-A70-like protein, partial [Absidia repens]